MAEQAKAAFGDYVRVIWSVYCERRGSDLPEASPAEYALMRRWWEQGIPARWVGMALRTTKGNGRTLAYYGPAVLDEARRAIRSMTS